MTPNRAGCAWSPVVKTWSVQRHEVDLTRWAAAHWRKEHLTEKWHICKLYVILLLPSNGILYWAGGDACWREGNRRSGIALCMHCRLQSSSPFHRQSSRRRWDHWSLQCMQSAMPDLRLPSRQQASPPAQYNTPTPLLGNRSTIVWEHVSSCYTLTACQTCNDFIASPTHNLLCHRAVHKP